MDLIANKYRVLKKLGTGSMGEVYLVLPPRGDPVAIKLLKTSDDSRNMKMAIEQFENEFKVLKKLSHPNIGEIYDYGFDQESQRVYFTSKWLKGEDLFIATKGLDFSEMEDYFIQVLRALNYLHQKNIIHCDIKPGNVIVENKIVQLIDFGLAGYWGDSIVGTPTYLAPEIFRGERHSVSSDLYAVGVMMYNVFTRTQPFAGKDVQEIYQKHCHHLPKGLAEINSEIPSYLSRIAFNLISKNPQDRFLSAASVIEEISTYSDKDYEVETTETLLSYLPKSSDIIGRTEASQKIQDQLDKYLANKGKNFQFIYLYGEQGTGKSKIINQIKIQLQLQKHNVEEAILPLSDADSQLMLSTPVIILEDIDQYLEVYSDASKNSHENYKALEGFISMLEQKVLSSQDKKFLMILSGSHPDEILTIEHLFPQDDLEICSAEIHPFTLSETEKFIESIIGQKNIPELFIAEIYRNTGGNPQICQQIIAKLIEQGLLFDNSGRWSEDLLSHLEGILDKLETPKSLEEKLHHEYNQFSEDEREIVTWLALSRKGLTADMISQLILKENISELIEDMVHHKIIRDEDDGYYVLYRSVYSTFITKLLSSSEIEDRHLKLASPDLNLPLIENWHHQSFSSDMKVSREALIYLIQTLTQNGERERALDYYYKLKEQNDDTALEFKIDWAILASENLIWLDQFSKAEEILHELEKSIQADDNHHIPLQKKLKLWEKCGVSLLHQQKIEEATSYFQKGLIQAQAQVETKVEEILFLNHLAQIRKITGHPEKALLQYENSRKLMANLPSEERLKITNNDLGSVYFDLKNFDQAIVVLKEDINLFKGLSNPQPLARTLYALAECFRATKQYNEAVVEYEKCIEICQKRKFFPLLLRAYNGLGNLKLTLDEYNQALVNYQKALEISVHLKDNTTKAALLSNQGLIYRQQKNWPHATRRFLLAKQILESKDKKLAYEEALLSKCYQELASIAENQNQTQDAILYRTQYVQVVEESANLKTEKFKAKMDLAKMYMENGLMTKFFNEIRELEKMAKTDEQIQQLSQLKQKWEKAGFSEWDPEATMPLGRLKKREIEVKN